MAYQEGQAQTEPPPAPSSLVGDSGQIVERLQNIYNRIVDLGNSLHGSRPRDANAIPGGKIEPEPALRRNLDKAGSWLHDIEGELQTISARL
jgi:hypothetical protein